MLAPATPSPATASEEFPRASNESDGVSPIAQEDRRSPLCGRGLRLVQISKTFPARPGNKLLFRGPWLGGAWADPARQVWLH
jgi:hypothetical protein